MNGKRETYMAKQVRYFRQVVSHLEDKFGNEKSSRDHDKGAETL